ncbi:very short patch repair endonuclease [Pedobacter paludis]|uniref:Very short patch repair endonuclease n=1 Tax=Pedobacter paludis TaxID=2203212 RepID=A0A317F5I1_9SPHI|nr:very short patch repair endonuclease [Pedobacter paludis]PWS33129.1 very short patch repair endonuclease [Pedobacter paludis]
MEPKPYPKENEIIKVPRFEESAGFYTTEQRSKNMANIRSKNSVPELKLRRALWAQHIRFRLHPKTVPGKPDLVINKYKLAIFVDGDFWHGYNWEKRRQDLKKNTGFWIPKIERNMQRDRHVNERLNLMGYTVMRFWEHEIKHNIGACVNQVLLYLEAAKTGKVPISSL